MNTFAGGKNFFRDCGRFQAGGVLFLALLTIGLAAPRHAAAQSAESADKGGARLSVGGGASGFTLGYGQRRMLGATLWVDGDTIRHIGIEGEARWLDFHQTADVHAETYLGGLRYHLNYGRMQPYLKGMAGMGHFNFSYNLATGQYFVYAGGGGLDYRLSRRWSLRGEFEYQNWPDFTYGAMTSVGVTGGMRYRIF